MIVVFARSNHPHGYGFSTSSDYQKPGIGAHGYVVIGVICQTKRQASRVIDYIRREGFDLPDEGRGQLYPEHPPAAMADGNRHFTDIGYDGVVRWYSGGPGDWDYLFTTPGNTVDWEWPQQATYGSRGDNRFTMVYLASEVLGS